MAKAPTHSEIQQKIKEMNEMMAEHWSDHFVFSAKWWFLLILTVAPWFLWWKVVDKTRIMEILLYGFLIIITSTFLDILGWNYSFWVYPNNLLGLCTPLVPIDYTLFPIFYMLVYQYFSSWKSFSIVLFIMSALFAFVLEPFAEWMSFYKPLNWHSIYSFPGYFLMGMFLKWLVLRIINIQKKE
ncbi:CBO0543 family protein [Priestia abyssalis]|uniref:CBO0543 family protein n=1 Tax=Priestia abyssalis TaxID=1221450 RepID=UPI00099553E0|nr:CBO0543 family protein [Priestia abyssalis]